MAVLLIDYENVNATDGLKGVEYLNEKDTVIIFYSHCCEKIRAEYIEAIEHSKCELKSYKLVKSGKNALDFYIASECGCLTQLEETQIAIISRDKGFSAVSDFFHIKAQNAVVVISSNIEKAFLALNEPEDVERRRRIMEKSKHIDISSALARMQEHKDFVNKIIAAFDGTVFEEQTTEILNFIEERSEGNLKLLYTSSLHKFGRKDGRSIYKILKTVV